MWAVFILPWFYFWLRGGWFARILAMLFWVPVVIACSGKILNGVEAPQGYEFPVAMVYLAASIVIAWLVSSLPTYVKAWRQKEGSGQSLALR